MNYEEWSKKNPPNKEGKLKPDKISKAPEFSAMYIITNDGKLKPGFGVELFHDRSKPRKSKWKWQLHLAENHVGIGVGRILIPVINLTAGPFYGYDKKKDSKSYGFRFSIFKF